MLFFIFKVINRERSVIWIDIKMARHAQSKQVELNKMHGQQM